MKAACPASLDRDIKKTELALAHLESNFPVRFRATEHGGQHGQVQLSGP